MPASCVRLIVEGCAVASVLGMLEEREAAARVRVEGLREEVARLAEVLEAAPFIAEGIVTTHRMPRPVSVTHRSVRTRGESEGYERPSKYGHWYLG
ncbi:hypothetical protein GCM10011579_067430 [Streptomyces albiflavescens]|uniref:Uncharacterized protein n=1 Tax=Streptomyces albiflavescens TaxID=1623582 RepID=A0A917YAR7_9ACTN|nr:hypothetical protein GCM10011579_067430 [Streptomyces albiflavescens]